jgi:hypothetical protein
VVALRTFAHHAHGSLLVPAAGELGCLLVDAIGCVFSDGSCTCFVSRLAINSWNNPCPARPAIPRAALMKTKPAPRSAAG